MKISRVYEVWTGGDMVEDFIYDRDSVLKLAREEVKREATEHPDDPAEVVVDEIIHYELNGEEDLELLEKEI